MKNRRKSAEEAKQDIGCLLLLLLFEVITYV